MRRTMSAIRASNVFIRWSRAHAFPFCFLSIVQASTPLHAACDRVAGRKPSAIAVLPVPVPVPVHKVKDKTLNGTHRWLGTTVEFHPNPKPKPKPTLVLA